MQNANVYNENGKMVSGTTITPEMTRAEQLEAYAKGCGWPNADAMRAHYPLDQYHIVERAL